MRVLLCLQKEGLVDGYDSVNTPDDLNNILSAQATEINCENTLDFVKNKDSVLREIVSKLRKGGRLLIKGNDLEEVSRAVTNGFLKVDDAINMLYSGRTSTSTIALVMQTLTGYGLNILNVRLSGVEYFISSERPQ